MIIKESSDELNPTMVVAEAAVVSRPARSLKDYFALAIATCGVGYLPLAPGTFGSLIGVGLYVLLRWAFMTLLWSLAARNRLNLVQIAYAIVTLELVAIFFIACAGTWAATRAEKLSGSKDPGKVVIDEVAGQLVALTAMPLEVESWWTIILAFVLFRFFDIVKPYPARRLESLPGGLGIMADDLVAGVYAALVVALVVVFRWFT
ncbi:MAG: phosphatidylglycerophosphatase A family protein [Pyrinomonadaceae bacterium]